MNALEDEGGHGERRLRRRGLAFRLFALLVAFWLPLGSEARTVRVATYNVLSGVGAVGSVEYNAVKAVLARINPDVVAFQELRTSDRPNWEALATELGYGHLAFSGSTGLSGGLNTGYYSRFPIASSFNVFSPAGANEITRPPFRVVVTVPGTVRPLVLWTLHHKALSSSTDRFRRAIESIRCADNIDAYLAANPGHLDLVVLGDMNEDVRATQPAQFNSLPSGLPASYALGSDITFPVYYATFPRDAYEVAGPGFAMLAAVQGTTTNSATYIGTSGRLDYIFVSSNLAASPLGPAVAEVYNSVFDDSSNGLAKVGAPLDAGISAQASDHLTVFADVQMQDLTLLSVFPETGIAATGVTGSEFSPTSWVYAVSNGAVEAVAWSVSTPDWLITSPTGGLLAANSADTLIVSLDPAVTNRSVGQYAAAVRIIDGATSGEVSRAATLTVLPPAQLAVNGAPPPALVKLPAAPFAPAAAVLTVTNRGFTDLAWEASAGLLVDLVPTNGLVAPGGSMQITLAPSALATSLPPGVTTAVIQVRNAVNGFGDTNITVTFSVIDAVGLFADVDSETTGWAASGLWHVTDTATSACARATSGTAAWWYGVEASCTYDTGTTNTGSLTSPSFLVPTNALLSFASWEVTEGAGTSWDRRIVQVTTNDGASWVTLFVSPVSAPQWQYHGLNLAPYAGRTARVRFAFDTVDPISNEFDGWFIDDIQVASAGDLIVTGSLPVRLDGPQGGPFGSAATDLVVRNDAATPGVWRLVSSPAWVSGVATQGVLYPGQQVAPAFVALPVATNYTPGLYTGVVAVRSGFTGPTNARPAQLLVNDQVPSAWRFAFFGHEDPRAVAFSRDVDDADGDGFANVEEYIAGTDPVDGGSAFLAPLLVGDPESGALTVVLPDTVAGRIYDVWGTEQLHDAAAWTNLGISVSGTGGSVTIPVTNPPALHLYRGRVRLP